MLAKKEIIKMFEDMGLGSEDERQRFMELGKLGVYEDVEKDQVFMLSVASTQEQEGEDDA